MIIYSSPNWYYAHIWSVNPQYLSVIKATGPRKWEYETQLMNLNWPCCFSKLKANCQETNLREFYYKFLYRIIIATEKELYHFGIESNKDCLSCNESDSIGHTFIDCYLSKSFFQSRSRMV